MSEESVAAETSEAPVESNEAPESNGQEGGSVANDPGQEAAESNPRDEFLSKLPEEYQADPAFQNFSDFGDLAKSYKHASQMIGADENDVFKVPKDGDLSAVYERLGRPESPDKYESDALSDGPLSEMVDKERISEVKELLHEKGVPQEAFDGLMQWYANDIQQSMQQQQQNVEQAINNNIDAVKEELGTAFDSRMRQIDQFIDQHGDEQLGELIDNNPHIFTHPSFIKMMANVAPQFMEDSGTKTGDPVGRVTPREAKMDLAAFEQENFKALSSKSHPKHKKVKQERERLYQAAYPNK